MSQLPHRQIWTIDTEVVADRGAAPSPVCLVAHELRSGTTVRQWVADIGRSPPHPTGPDVLVIAWYAMAEWSYFLAAGWRLPDEAIDLHAEFRTLRNGRFKNHPSLLDPLVYPGLAAIGKDAKQAGRDLMLRGGPWTTAERAEIVDYCASDTLATAGLFRDMLPAILARPHGLAHALLRGAYTTSLARVERRGVPVSLAGWERLTRQLPAIKPRLIEVVDRDFRRLRRRPFSAISVSRTTWCARASRAGRARRAGAWRSMATRSRTRPGCTLSCSRSASCATPWTS